MGAIPHSQVASSSSEEGEDVEILLAELLELGPQQRPQVLGAMCARFPEYPATGAMLSIRATEDTSEANPTGDSDAEAVPWRMEIS